MNWYIIISAGIAAILLIWFLIKRNMKDEKTFEKEANQDYQKTKDEEGDVEETEKM